MWLLRNGQDWTRRISQACFRGALPKNTFRFGRFRRVPQTQQVAGLGTNSLAYEGTYPNHPRESKWSKGQRRQEPDAVSLGHPGEPWQTCFIPTHTTTGSSCDLTGDMLPTRQSSQRLSTQGFCWGIVILAYSACLCQAPKFRLHKGRQILSKTHVVCVSI